MHCSPGRQPAAGWPALGGWESRTPSFFFFPEPREGATESQSPLRGSIKKRKMGGWGQPYPGLAAGARAQSPLTGLKHGRRPASLRFAVAGGAPRPFNPQSATCLPAASLPWRGRLVIRPSQPKRLLRRSRLGYWSLVLAPPPPVLPAILWAIASGEGPSPPWRRRVPPPKFPSYPVTLPTL